MRVYQKRRGEIEVMGVIEKDRYQKIVQLLSLVRVNY